MWERCNSAHGHPAGAGRQLPLSDTVHDPALCWQRLLAAGLKPRAAASRRVGGGTPRAWLPCTRRRCPPSCPSAQPRSPHVSAVARTQGLHQAMKHGAAKPLPCAVGVGPFVGAHCGCGGSEVSPVGQLRMRDVVVDAPGRLPTCSEAQLSPAEPRRRVLSRAMLSNRSQLLHRHARGQVQARSAIHGLRSLFSRLHRVACVSAGPWSVFCSTRRLRCRATPFDAEDVDPNFMAWLTDRGMPEQKVQRGASRPCTRSEMRRWHSGPRPTWRRPA